MTKKEPTPKVTLDDNEMYRVAPSASNYGYKRWSVVWPNGSYEGFDWKWTAQHRANQLNRHALAEKRRKARG